MINSGVPERFAESFAQAANGSRSLKTWKQRKSVLNLINKCRADVAEDLPFPWADVELMHFVGWCMDEGKKRSTIEQYVSNIRSLHKEMNLCMIEEKRAMIMNVIKGHGNLANPSPARIPMTPDLMFHLKRKLSNSRLPESGRRLVWLAACALFQGSFRVGELLSPTTNKFCPDTTLLSKDVVWEKAKIGNEEIDLLKFRIKKPKETRGSTIVDVEIFDLNNCFYSCTNAWRKWKHCSKLENLPNLPVFRWENGSLLTANQMNKILKEMMEDKVVYTDGFVATHSFRGGLATVMAQLGYPEEQIKLQGRWASDSYKNYVKMGRSARIKDQWTLANQISSLIGMNGSLSRL